jgi:RimJ/RimL family protein N-acetyltransferase
MIIKPINTPYPLWDLIRGKMTDYTGDLATEGNFIGAFDDDGSMIGAFSIRLWNTVCYEIHGGIHPENFGRGVEICGAVGDAIFKRTPCIKLIAPIPEYNSLMIRCVKMCGMKQEGSITRAFMKDMKLYNILLFGITKAERSSAWAK